MQQAKRPLPEGHSLVKAKTHLELRYLRWDYFVRSPNVDDSIIVSKNAIVKKCARKIYSKFRYEFDFMGMGIEDLENIGRVQVVSYLGLWGKDGKGSDKNLASFISQRLLEAADILRQYNKKEATFQYISVYKGPVGTQIPDTHELMDKNRFTMWKKARWSELSSLPGFLSGAKNGDTVEKDGFVYLFVKPGTSAADLEEDGIFEKIPTQEPEDPETLMIQAQTKETRLKTVGDVSFRISKEELFHSLVPLLQKRSLQKKRKFLQRLRRWCNLTVGNIERKNEIAKNIDSLVAHYTRERQRENKKNRREESFLG